MKASKLSDLSPWYPFLDKETGQRLSGVSDPLESAEVYGGIGVFATLSSYADDTWKVN